MPPDNRDVPVVLPSQLNQRQLFVYEIVRAYKDGLGEREALRMIVLLIGTAGTGKSWLVNALVDLLIEPMPFEKFSKLGDKPTFQLRLQEEVRLRALTGETLHLHGGVA